jgi:hypothetical protein
MKVRPNAPGSAQDTRSGAALQQRRSLVPDECDKQVSHPLLSERALLSIGERKLSRRCLPSSNPVRATVAETPEGRPHTRGHNTQVSAGYVCSDYDNVE